MECVKSYIDFGVVEGVILFVGGNLWLDKGGGWFVELMCFVDVENGMCIVQEEIFGFVLVVIFFDDDEDVICIVNDSFYGFFGGVWLGNFDRVMVIVKCICMGNVSVNGGVLMSGDLFFGGYKQFGVGCVWGIEGIEEYFEIKVIVWWDQFVGFVVKIR